MSVALGPRESGQASQLDARVGVRQRASGRLPAALAALLPLLWSGTVAAQTVIATSQLQTCIASGSCSAQHLPSRVHGGSFHQHGKWPNRMPFFGLTARFGVHGRRWMRRWAARRSW